MFQTPEIHLSGQAGITVALTVVSSAIGFATYVHHKFAKFEEKLGGPGGVEHRAKHIEEILESLPAQFKDNRHDARGAIQDMVTAMDERFRRMEDDLKDHGQRIVGLETKVDRRLRDR